MIERPRRIRPTKPKKRQVFTGSVEQRLRARMEVLEQLKPEDVTTELWRQIESLEAIRTWSSTEHCIQPIGSKAKYTTTDVDFGPLIVVLQREIDRLRPPRAASTTKSRKPLAVLLAESKAREELLDAKLDVVKKDVRRLSQELEKKKKTVRGQEGLIDHYERKIDMLTQENNNLKGRIVGFERFTVVP